MPLLVLGFFCLREFRTHSTPKSFELSNKKHRTGSRQHRQRNHRLNDGRRRHNAISIQHRPATIIRRHRFIRSPFKHDPLQSRSRQMALIPTVSLRSRQHFPSFPDQLRRLLNHSVPARCGGVRVYPRWPVDSLDLVHQERNGEEDHGILDWKPIRSSIGQVDRLRNTAHQRSRWPSRLVLAVRSYGRFHDCLRYTIGLLLA